MLKNPEGKKYTEYQYSEKFQGISVFQGKRELLKNPESKKYIPYSENFQCKRKLFKTPECKKYILSSENFQGKGKLRFQGKRKLLKILNMKSIFTTVKIFRASGSCSKIVNCEKFFNTVYIHLGTICVIWANVVCNQDQRRDRL